MNKIIFIVANISLLYGCVSNQPVRFSSDEFSDTSDRGLLIQDIDAPTKKGPEINSVGNQKFKNVSRPIQPISREELAKMYKDVLEENPEPYMIPEARKRLADLAVESGGETSRSTKNYLPVTIISTGRSIKQPAHLGKDNAAAVDTKAYNKIIAQYKALLSGDSPDIDKEQVYFQLSRAYIQMGDDENALLILNEMLRVYPDSIYAGEANFRRGELYFSVANYKEAARAYQMALAEGEASSFFVQALYKNGWALYRQDKYHASLNSLFSLFDASINENAQGVNFKDLDLSASDDEMLSDALHAISLNFSNQDGVASINEYFENNGEPSYAHMIYQDLGDYYFEKQRITDCATAYKAYIEKFPAYDKAVDLNIWIVAYYKKHGFIRLSFENKKEFVQRYKVDGDRWLHISEASRQKLFPYLKEYLQELSGHFHAKAQKSHKLKDYAVAAEWYRMYLHAFKDSPESARLNFFLAENLFDGREYGEAAIEYDKTAYHYTRHEKSMVAGYSALLSYKKMETKYKSDEHSRWRRLRISSALQYGASFPEDENTPAVLIEAAEDLYKSKDYKRAIGPATTVTSLSSVKASLLNIAFTILAHSEFELGNYARAEKAYLRLKALISETDKKYSAVEEKLAASIYQQGEADYNNGDFVRASEHFARVALLAPNSSIRVIASYDSATALIAAEEWQAAIGSLTSFREVFSNLTDVEMEKNIRDKLIVAYLAIGMPLKAADELVVLAESSNDTEIIWSATAKIVEIYTHANNLDLVSQALKHYIRRAPVPLEKSIEVRQQLADLYIEIGDTDKRHYWLKQIIAVDRKEIRRSTERTRYLAVMAASELADYSYDLYTEIQLVAPLQKNMKKKKQRMKLTLDAYGLAADYGVAEATTSATYKIAEIYREFAISLLESERPSNLSEEELEQYDILLEEEAFPFEDKAIEVHETNSSRAVIGDYDEWVTKSFSQLAVLRPARYAKEERGIGVFNGIR